MGPSRGTGGLSQSSASSGIFFQGDLQPQALVNSHLSSSFGNTTNSIPGTGCLNLGSVSGDMNNAAINSVPNSAPSVGASSLVTDANSAFSGGPHLRRSASFNTDSYIRLPASPMSFSSNNVSISGSSVRDGSSIVQQNSHHDPNGQHVTRQLQGVSRATSLPSIQASQSQIPMVARGSGSFIQDPSNLLHLQKKPRLDMKQEEMLNQQVIQQLLQRQDLQFEGPQLHAFLQQQRLRQQHFLQSMPQLQRAQSQQQHMQLREQLQQQAMQPLSSLKRPYDGGVCARRLMQYLYHQHQRPQDNNIVYWRKFVSEYYSPRAKKRWCLSLYENVGHHALGAFPQNSMDGWQCDICGSKSGKGFETTFEVLPILNEIKFGSGVIDELLFVDLPRECRFPSGIMMLEYGKAVQESVYEQLRVVREGHLRIIFTQDLKILSWEFCVRRHEELLPRRLVQPQVNQLVQIAQKCQSTISGSGSDSISQQDLHTNGNMILTAGRQLAKSLELQSLNDLGFSKRYVRCLQISEVVNSMRDLIDFCREHKAGPIDGLKNYLRHASAPKLQMQKMQEMEQLTSVQGLGTDRNAIDKMVPLHSNQISSNHNLVSGAALSGSSQAAMQLTNFQNLLLRQNSMNSNSNSLQQEASSSFNPNQIPPSTIRGASSLDAGSLQNLHVRGVPSAHLGPQHLQHLQQRTLNANSLLQQSHSQSSQGNQSLQQQMIQKLLQGMSNTDGGGMQPQSLAGPNSSVGMVKCFGGNPSSMAASTTNISGSNGPAPSRSNSFKCASNGDSSVAGANKGFSQRAADASQNLHLQDVVQDIAREFTDNGFFNSDLDDNLGYGWKA